MAGLSPNTFSGPYIANGTQRAFPFTFTALNDFDVTVLVDGVAANRALYVVTLVENGGTVTFGTAPAAGRKILPYSEPDFAQLSEFANQGAYNLDTVNKINRRASVRDLYLLDGLKRSLRVPIGETAPPIPSPKANPQRALGTDAGGNLGWVRLEQLLNVPERVDYVASAGQTHFPAIGELPFIRGVDPTLLAVFVAGLLIPASDYTLAGPRGPVVFDVGRDADEEVTISNYTPVAGDQQGFAGGGQVRPIYARNPGDTTPRGTDEFELAYAFSKSLRVYCPAGGGTGPNGEYYTSSMSQNTVGYEDNVGNVVPGCELFGDGMDQTVFLQRPSTSYAFFYNPPGRNRIEYADSVPGPYFHDFTIVTLPINDFEEHSHQIMLNGMRGIRIVRVRGLGAKGDMLHLGQGDVPPVMAGAVVVQPGQVRFNGDAVVDIWGEGYAVAGKRGANNRNVLSVLSCDGLSGTVRGKNFSRPGGAGAYNPVVIDTGAPMPGIVDIEPNGSGDSILVRNVDLAVYGENIGGFGAALFMPSAGVAGTIPVTNVRLDVSIKNARGRYSVYGDPANTVPYNLRLSGEDYGCERPFEIIRCRDLTIEGHSYNFKYPALWGYVEGNAVNDSTCNNHFHGGPTLGGGAIWIRGGNGNTLGGSATGGDVGYTFLSTNVVSNMTITADVKGQSAYAFNVVNYGDGEPSLDWSTIDATGCNVHDQISSGYVSLAFPPRDWAARGALVATYPRTGAVPFGHKIFVKPYVLGDATEIVAVGAVTYAKVATTTNGALATAYANGQTVDGVVLATGNRILLKDQTAAIDNGLYVVNASGAPTRASDADTGAELANATIFVSEGGQQGTQWTCTAAAPITLGSTSLPFVKSGPVWGVQRRLEPAPADATSTYDTVAGMTVGRVKRKSAGRLYAVERGYAFDPVVMTVTSGASVRLELAAPDHATTGSYYWFKTNAPVGLDEIGLVGIYFGGGGALATWGANPSNLNFGDLGGAEYARQFALQLDVTSPTNLQCTWYRKNDAGAWVAVPGRVLNTPITGGTSTLYRFAALESGEAGQITKWGAP